MSWYEKILKGKPDADAASFKIEVNANLKWIADQNISSRYQLIEENRTIGSLVFTKKSKRAAAGKIYGLEFIIKSHWLFQNKILIEQTGCLKRYTMIITDFHKSGMIELENNERLFWGCFRNLEYEYSFSNERNKKLIVFKPVTSFYKSGYFVKIKSKDLDKLSTAVLLLLGIYNLIVFGEETGTASIFI